MIRIINFPNSKSILSKFHVFEPKNTLLLTNSKQFQSLYSSDNSDTTTTKKIPKYFLEGFRNKIKIDEIREELSDTINFDNDKKMTPQKIKEELDKYIIGQDHVKKSLAICLRARYRKKMVFKKSKTEGIKSHNMLIAGKSGSGKTEMLRQTAKICNSPFIKVEAVRYTEVGYHGDDVENIIGDLFKKTRNEFIQNIKNIFWSFNSVKSSWEHFILSYLLGKSYERNELYNQYAEKLHKGELDNLDLKVWYYDKDRYETFKISDIKAYFFKESYYKISQEIDFDEIIKKNIEERAIVCVDEFDKLIRDKTVSNSSKASDEGVQNDFLPLFDGSEVPVSDGKKVEFFINTKNILFVAAGAFQKHKPNELIVEIQGRLPTSAEMKPLTKDDFVKILKESNGSALKSAILTLKTEGIHINFTDKAIEEIGKISEEINNMDEDTGARRLVQVIDIILDDVNFYAPDIYQEIQQPGKFVVIDIDEIYVREKCEKILKKKDLRKHIL